MNSRFQSLGIKSKLIALFIVIKVIPLLLLAGLAWKQTQILSQSTEIEVADMASNLSNTLVELGYVSSQDSIQALDNTSQRAIERLSNETAQRVADFLYERDADIRMAANLNPSEVSFKAFLNTHSREVVNDTLWRLNSEETGWEVTEQAIVHQQDDKEVKASIKKNDKSFHYNPPYSQHTTEQLPLYLEMTFIDLEGQEKVKVTTSGRLNSELRDISKKRNTYVKAENYFQHLKHLQPGEIYVSEVIGAYIPSKIIGVYTPEAAKAAGIAFAPEESAYAGKENPLGKRFQGLVRWATPYVQNGQIEGYITLALNHDHLMEFTDYLTPADDHYLPISDASTGNYAFMWDYLGRNISHPRDYFITGYDPENGEPAIPWLAEPVYKQFVASGKSYAEFSEKAPSYANSGGNSKPSIDLKKQGYIGLDCRYLDFAPQCLGWHNLTSQGGSGSFMIFWSGLWKLTTASTIPYYTGQYASSKRGFGFVTVGANVDEFHSAAVESQDRLLGISESASADASEQQENIQQSIQNHLKETAMALLWATLLMTLAVVVIAILIASFLSSKINIITAGINRFKQGDLSYRLPVSTNDEIGAISVEFNAMANDLGHAFDDLKHYQEELETLVQERTKELQLANEKMECEIQERKVAQARIEKIASFDSLTGLTNRMQFRIFLDKFLSDAVRHKRKLALMYIDLDGFKDINDTKGHETGDALLKKIARSMQDRLRNSDVIARLGGDEFAIAIRNFNSNENLAVMAEELIQTLSQPVKIQGDTIQVGLSIGIAVFPDDAFDLQSLMSHADTAMYNSKNSGGNRYCFFEESMYRHILYRKKIKVELQEALAKNRFVMHYQPKNSVQNGAVAGAEALIRWLDEDGSVHCTPSIFIPIAEESELILDLECWTIRQTCIDAKLWFDQNLLTDAVSVNLSYRHLVSESLVDDIKNIFKETGFNPKNLEVEITESVMRDDKNIAFNNLKKLHQLGVKISIDDFGTGYSSFKRFGDLHVDSLKIDKAFIQNLDDGKNKGIIRAIITMAEGLGIKTIVEGVETKKQWDFLKEERCDEAQGFLFLKPCNKDEFYNYLLVKTEINS